MKKTGGWYPGWIRLIDKTEMTFLAQRTTPAYPARNHVREQNQQWISCQLGAREHYAVPRALHRSGRLSHLVTDFWVKPGNPLASVKQTLRERFQVELLTANVRALNFSALAFETHARMAGLAGWDLILKRNEWFQRQAVALLNRVSRGLKGESVTLFAYSYAARVLFEFARAQGWRTVLGQIDPALPEERIVAGIYADHPEQRGEWQPAPHEYWDGWRRECALADRIVVNSAWARDALLAENVAAEKISVIPLAFHGGTQALTFRREYPDRFTAERPLRALFLGQVNLRKGVAPLLQAIELLGDAPVEFWLIGPVQITVPPAFRDNPRVKWIGPVPRGETAQYYQQADVFIFPTLSDGFGLTQLEAQAWRLPIIASRFCGDVVEDGVNGVRLPEVSGAEIARVLMELMRQPERLSAMAERSFVSDRFSLNSLGAALLDL